MSKSKGPKWLLILVVVFLAMLGIAGGFLAWRAYVVKAQETRSYSAAKELIAQNRGGEALVAISQHNRTIRSKDAENLARWSALEIAALSQVGHLPRLLALFDRTPQLFQEQETATLQVARAILHTGNFEAFDKLRAEWKGRESALASWFELEVDALLLRGRREDAIALLNSRTFPGGADCGRLARLALVNTPANLKAAWQYLDQAAKLDPRNSEVRLFRGQILEGVGKRVEAQVEFQAAFAANTNSSYFRDQLGEFFRRNGSYDYAVVTWAGGLPNPQSTDLIWLRAVFWTKVTRTIKFDLAAGKPPFGPNQPFVQYLLALRPNLFWDEAAFEKIPEARRYDQQLQETFWLRLLDLLANEKEEEAMKLLEFNRFRTKSWQPELESAVLRVLGYRKSGEMKLPVGVNIALSDAPPKSRHQLLEQIDSVTKDPNQKLPEDLDRLLRGKNAFTAVFLAAGWAGAALGLPHDEVIPDGLPEWLAYGLTQATRFNKGNAPALAFATRQKSSPTLELLTGEILASDGKFDEALRKLSPLATLDSDVGMRAASYTAQIHVQRKQYTEARVAIETLPRLKQSVVGQEMLAHLALLQNKADEAAAIYAAIEDQSDEAKSFLAQRAFLEKNWARARRLTGDLVKKHPENAQFRANLAAIEKAEAGR